MATLMKTWGAYTIALIVGLMALIQDASAVPSYSRRYGEECSTCHGNMWGALTPAGITFKLSGYRAIFGKDLTPLVPDVEISKGVTVPSTLPLSFVTGVGIDSRHEERSGNGTAGLGGTTSNGTSLALEDASIFMSSPIGNHLAGFVEFPMYETRAWEFTPTGNFESRFNQASRQIKFGTESPTFEVAKFFWNNLAGPRDALNVSGGITHLPLAYSPGKVRLSVNQYPIYERTALDLISPRKLGDGVFTGDPNDNLFRLSEPQVQLELFGMYAFNAPVTEVGNKNTVWSEYHFGISNGTNAKAANNPQKDIYGRFVVRYYGQSLGVFALHSPDTYSDNLRTTASILGNPNTTTINGAVVTQGIMSGAQTENKADRIGLDMTVSLVPFGMPFYLENQYMRNRESNPTGFGTEFKWHGGFSQLNWKYNKTSIAYLRYDYVKGDSFNDTASTVNGVNGITFSEPRERDWVLGWQHLLEQNIKLVAEYRYHRFDDLASGTISAASATNLVGVAAPYTINEAHLKDDGFTLRMMFGF